MRPGPANSVPAGTFEESQREGQALWEQLRPELGPEWLIAYATFPDDGRHLQWEPDGPAVRG